MNRGRKPLGERAMTGAERQTRFRASRGGSKSATFGIASSLDFYAMLVADFDDYMAERQSARRALHCAITAFHLHEWVWGDWLKADFAAWKRLGVRDKDSFLAWIRRECRWFETIEGLAVGAKHFTRHEDFTAMRVGAPPFMFDEIGTGWGEGA